MSKLDSLRHLIKSTFSLHDKRNALMKSDPTSVPKVPLTDAANIFRYLGQFPTEYDLIETIYPSIEDIDNPGYIEYVNLEREILKSLSSHSYDPDDRELIIAALRKLSVNGVYLDLTKFREMCGNLPNVKDQDANEFIEYIHNNMTPVNHAEVIATMKDEDQIDAISGHEFYFAEDYAHELTDFISRHLSEVYRETKDI